jgi:hypothetical protein
MALQKLASDEEDAADEAAAAAAPEPGLTTRRSLRSRTTSHKIDPTQFAEDDEADEEKEERSSPGAGVKNELGDHSLEAQSAKVSQQTESGGHASCRARLRGNANSGSVAMPAINKCSFAVSRPQPHMSAIALPVTSEAFWRSSQQRTAICSVRPQFVLIRPGKAYGTLHNSRKQAGSEDCGVTTVQA